MDTHKDNNKITLNSYGQTSVSFNKNFTNKDPNSISVSYDFANKKTEKLVTALYMVTDCMDGNDALARKLRNLGVELLSDIYKISTLQLLEKSNQVNLSLVRISEIISCIDIASTVGFISNMNTTILKREFDVLVSELKSFQDKETHFTFGLNDEMFTVPLASTNQNNLEDHPIKDNNPSHSYKSSFSPKMSFMKTSASSVVAKKENRVSHRDASEKIERNKAILALIKDKKEVSIKDISNVLKDCSEKTIQRELNHLVHNGQVTKVGSKRWSRYIFVK